MSKKIKYEWANSLPSIDFIPRLAYPQKLLTWIEETDSPERYVFDPKIHKAEFVPPKPVRTQRKRKKS